MSDLNEMSNAARSAAMRGGMDGWGQYGSSEKHIRYMEPRPSTSRRRCPCGCKRRSTHSGMVNGMALCGGCELSMRRWVKNGDAK